MTAGSTGGPSHLTSSSLLPATPTESNYLLYIPIILKGVAESAGHCYILDTICICVLYVYNANVPYSYRQ